MNRSIEEINLIRKDLSPFLVHLTKDSSTNKAQENLTKILEEKEIKKGNFYGLLGYCYGNDSYPGLSKEEWNKKHNKETSRTKLLNIIRKKYSLISLTETPLDQIQCLIDIKDRQIELTQFGIVLLKDKIKMLPNIGPVCYLNTYNSKGREEIEKLREELYQLAFTKKNIIYVKEKKCNLHQLLNHIAFLDVFGKPLNPSRTGIIDFSWEREWRSLNNIKLEWTGDINLQNVFIGLCDNNDIGKFEKKFPNLPFIDPLMNLNYFSDKIGRRQKELNIKNTIL
jgi:hypothetical protein